MNYIKIVLLAALLGISPNLSAQDTRPNVLWITIEDWSPDLSCYGTKGIHTPNVDKLAAEGIRYNQAFSTAPVCSPSRSAMMTGFHQNYIGANQHREYDKQPLPYDIKPIPHLMKEAGYFTALMSWKTDLNFVPNTKKELFDGEDWSERKPGQPFFARITFSGTHRYWVRDPNRPIDIADVELPPYYPDTDFCKRDWANGLEQMQLVDQQVGELLQRLEEEGLADNTLVFFIADHGRCHIRGKQFLYDGGIRIPMIMRWPGKVKAGQVSEEMVMTIDIGATILETAGVKAPIPLHGKSLFSEEVKQRKYVFAARDKMDETHDAMRAIRSKDYKLILNLMPERPYCQYNHYKEGSYPMLAEMNIMNLKGELTPAQAAFLSPNKPEVELFDLNEDPHEINNLAENPAYSTIKTELLAELENWRKNVINDKSLSTDFLAKDIFPSSFQATTVDKWVENNLSNYDFNKNGWPAWYPTRTLEEWEKVRSIWEPYVFREPGMAVLPPKNAIVYSQKKQTRNYAKFDSFRKYFNPTSTNNKNPYQPDWTSLQRHQTPEWLIDAKFGIYTHWGPVSEAMEGADPSKRYRGWHGMIMYQDGKIVPTSNGKPSNNYEHHVSKYGDPAKFGYKHVIEQFNPSNFDAAEWAEIFHKSGAKFAGPVAMHHDNFAMWNSKATRWNAMNYGGIDPSLELKKAIEAKGMKFMASFHHAFTWKYFAPAHAYGGVAPEDYDLYTNPHSIESDTPDEQFYKDWWAKLKEYMDTYQPDLIWFDWWLENLSEESRQHFLSYYYNKGMEWEKEVAVCYKETTFPNTVAIKDYERGRPNQPKSPVWLTDTSPGAWFYRPNAKFNSPNELIDILIDIVAKNGLMLLNVPPDPDGTIPPVMVNLLTDMGNWLKINGDAIYGTRPWTVFGEGPTRLPEGGHKIEKRKISYTNKDIRYTKKSEKEFYAIVMDKPAEEIILKTLSTDIGALNAKINNIQLLGSEEVIKWERNENGLIIQAPKLLPSDYAHAFKITLEGYTETAID